MDRSKHCILHIALNKHIRGSAIRLQHMIYSHSKVHDLVGK